MSRWPPWAATTSAATARPRPAAAAVAGRGPRRGGRTGARRRRGGRRGCRARRRRRRRATGPSSALDGDAHACESAWRAALATTWSTARRTRPSSPTTSGRRRRRRRPRPGPASAARRRRGRRRRSRTGCERTPCSSPRASSSRSSTRPCSRSSSPSRTPDVAVPVGRRSTTGDLQLGAHHGDGCAQLVRGVGHQSPARGRRRLQPRRACRSSSWPARRSRRPTPAREPARAASRSRSTATRDVTAWTGRSARPASSHASPATRATSAGPTNHSSRRVVSIVSATLSSDVAVASTTSPTGATTTE